MGSKGYLALEAGYRESKELWGEVLRQAKARGVKSARLFVGDGELGLWAAVGVMYPKRWSSFAGIIRCLM